MAKLVSVRSSIHLIGICITMIITLLFVGIAYSDLKEFRNSQMVSNQTQREMTSTAVQKPQDSKVEILWSTFLAFIICLPVILVAAPIFILAADKNLFGYGVEARTITLNIFLFLAVALSLCIGITLSYVAYQLQCTDVPRSIMLKIVIAAILAIFPAAFIIFLQINDRVDKFTDMLTKETLQEKSVQSAAEKLLFASKLPINASEYEKAKLLKIASDAQQK